MIRIQCLWCSWSHEGDSDIPNECPSCRKPGLMRTEVDEDDDEDEEEL